MWFLMSNLSRVQVVKSQHFVTIPLALAKALGLSKGDMLEWRVEGDALLLRKKWGRNER